jgi:hypothetical protein
MLGIDGPTDTPFTPWQLLHVAARLSVGFADHASGLSTPSVSPSDNTFNPLRIVFSYFLRVVGMARQMANPLAA